MEGAADDRLDGLRILVVEDAFPVAELIGGMLGTLRCEVVGPVGRLNRAVQMAREAPIDGAILDVNLGGTDVARVQEILCKRHAFSEERVKTALARYAGLADALKQRSLFDF